MFLLTYWKGKHFRKDVLSSFISTIINIFLSIQHKFRMEMKPDELDIKTE